MSLLTRILFPVIFISGLGYIYAKLNKTEPQIISEIIMYLTIPALFFISFYKQEISFYELPVTLATILAVVFGVFLITFLLRKIFKLPRGIYLPAVFMNSAFIGFPIVLLAYGAQGLSRAIAYDFFNGLLIFTFGIFIASGKKDAAEAFKLPFFYAAIAGLLLNLYNIKVPPLILKPIEMLGSTTIILALLMLGFRMGTAKIKTLLIPILSSFLRMVVGSFIAMLVVYLFKIEPSLGKVLIIMSALPSAFMGLVIGEKYKKDLDVISSSIAVCTLLSVLYIPFLLWLLK
ncbi:MAG: auxin efflux carrier [Candidatus Saganbacteria bacterium]|uniref:Auxin efflux carrier n=1 Tax=Candidatus Saganbacteria bacterium TaxID=2575572 RepID=A0A833KZT5_UNCSA|nr:MAG: auxin efflux carrier [Candidatus Saganbacteria bacterium]